MAAPIPLPGAMDGQEISADEQAVLSRAEDADVARDQAFQEMSPIGTYSMESLNILVDSLNEALPLFEIEEPYPSFEEGIEDGPLPPEFVAGIEMLRAAALDAGLERLAPDIGEAVDDSSIEDSAAKIDTLVENQTFRTFLRSSDGLAEEEVAEEEVAVEEDVISDEEADALFAERL
tara:strand:+ start:300 stop:830 length:531 start_codon:yes stop_codon:yes gene_type:complete